MFYLFIHLFIPLLNSIYITDCWLSACAPAFYMLMLYKSIFAATSVPRCPNSKTDPQRLAALHCLLVYMGNDPKLELKVQILAENAL